MIEPKIYHDWGKCMKIGPLGFWKPGDSVTLRGAERVVTSVDIDGMAITYTPDIVEMHDDQGRPTRSREAGVKIMSTGRNGDGATSLNARQREQCKAIAAVGQRLREASEA